MADSDVVSLAYINFYIREKFWHHLQEACQTGLRKYGNDPILKFFHAWGLVKVSLRVRARAERYGLKCHRYDMIQYS